MRVDRPVGVEWVVFTSVGCRGVMPINRWLPYFSLVL